MVHEFSDKNTNFAAKISEDDTSQMTYLGELISIGVAFSWTATALLSEFGSKRLGNLTLNVLRMSLTLLFSLVLFGVVTGSILPPGA